VLRDSPYDDGWTDEEKDLFDDAYVALGSMKLNDDEDCVADGKTNTRDINYDRYDLHVSHSCDFNKIRLEFLPGKATGILCKYFCGWVTTDRGVKVREALIEKAKKEKAERALVEEENMKKGRVLRPRKK